MASDDGTVVRRTLVQMLDEEELAHLERTGAVRYRPDSPLGGRERFCLLCMRRIMGDLVAWRECLGNAPYELDGKPVTFQCVSNPSDGAERYTAAVLMLPAADGQSNGLCAPLARLHYDRLRWTQRGAEEASAPWFLDHSAMLERPDFRQRTVTRV
jgi:hypothetical protein